MSEFQPFADETASSFAWRVAGGFSMGLHEFCPMVLGLDSETKQRDLDLVLTREAARRLAEVCGLKVADVRRLALPEPWTASTWDGKLRRHWARIYACPDCLAAAGRFSKRRWRTRVAFRCEVHRRFLVGSCQNCGEILRYRADYMGRAGVHWLDRWPLCGCCGEDVASGRVVPDWIAVVAGKIDDAFNAYEDGGGELPLLQLAGRMHSRVSAAPRLVQACARRIEWLSGTNCLAVVAALLVDQLLHLEKGIARATISDDLFNLAVGGEFNPETVAETLTERVASSA